MKQVLQSYKTGELQLAEVPAPTRAGYGRLLVRTCASVVSVGTEKAMIDVAKKSLMGKAVARPDWVKQVLEKVRTEGIMEAYRQSMARLERPMPMGYSSAGVVIESGEGVTGFSRGDRVACSGSGYASHAEVVSVPANLCASIPEAVSFEEAAFVALGGIALQAVRMARVELGHTVGVIGLGLLGQFAVQLLKAAGCHVVGMDLKEERCILAEEQGAEAAATDRQQLTAIGHQLTGGIGLDAVIIMAATQSNEPLQLAAELCRERGRVVAAGLVGLEIPRKPFYEKELDFVVSRAWGPGMYDLDFEERNARYPPAYVRWTAQANMAEFLNQVGAGRVRLDKIITHRFPFDRALEAYNLVLKGKEPYIGVLLTYLESYNLKGRIDLKSLELRERKQQAPIYGRQSGIGVSLIGVGLFARGTLLPALSKVKGVKLRGAATAAGASGRWVANKYGLGFCTTDPMDVLNDPDTQLVLVLTRHGSHARWVCEALRSGKHVFVEKPLCINEQQLNEIVQTYNYSQVMSSRIPLLMVGFNRRFAPTTQEAIRLLSGTPGPLMVSVRVNTGAIPRDSWVHDPREGGGSIIGEVCHFVDLIQALTGSVPVQVHAQPFRNQGDGLLECDNVAITLTMADGSVGTIVYTTMGDKAYERERVEIFGGGAVCVIENFKTLTLTRGGKRKRMGQKFKGVDRGHRAEMESLIASLQDGSGPPVPFESYVATTRTTFSAMDSLRAGGPVAVSLDDLMK